MDKSEEFHKNNLRDFLNKVYYESYRYLNIKDNNDLVIYHSKNTDGKVVAKNYISSKTFDESIKYLTTINKKLVKEFDFFLNGLNAEEINIGLKIRQNCQF
ncbi:hypothetical protein GM3708_1947 [Geminocystis sp. NIES-3708]|uniref:DUF7149 domain-containing protein n=1 Tax=Geminocystis sp. NIES-3708 TaxID=1615909 RepID=UPI0005FC84B3|nr:hypothetical protein [Geminocystis sp. NIES-3708]BAQ61541.1 hypothetical protein GM3708_1947 [Geminocystis sp. NIES-3708]